MPSAPRTNFVNANRQNTQSGNASVQQQIRTKIHPHKNTPSKQRKTHQHINEKEQQRNHDIKTNPEIHKCDFVFTLIKKFPILLFFEMI